MLVNKKTKVIVYKNTTKFIYAFKHIHYFIANMLYFYLCKNSELKYLDNLAVMQHCIKLSSITIVIAIFQFKRYKIGALSSLFQIRVSEEE